ncbi:MAG: heparinase II/III family protein [Verrucomicrobia bacterium]|nr:heparinase II/III family protein [Verrucomicrobiota bacterium]
MERRHIEEEIRRRADDYLRQNHLMVDYRRIRRRLAYPLPLRSLHLPGIKVPGIPVYPWASWMIWELEERIGCLGWARHWFQDGVAREVVMRDLSALASWPVHRQYSYLDLCLAHAARILCAAYAEWPWLKDQVRQEIQSGLQRIVEDGFPLFEKRFGIFHRAEDILGQDEPHALLHNIPVIGAIGVSLAANCIRDSRAETLNEGVSAILGALLHLRQQGYSEGVCYDGYVLDFVAGWLGCLPVPQRSALLEHPEMARFLDESRMLGVPGDIMQVAELGDVEPRRMPFHASAQARLYRLKPDSARAWYLKRCRVDWLRADALATLHPVVEQLRGKPPASGAMDAHHAVVLRSGWESEDLAVAMAASNSPMGHVQCDNGSVVIGTRGRWFIADPGYPQYMPGSERDFTLGPTAHNAPVINDQAQNRKAGRRLALVNQTADVCRAEMDLTRCYAPELRLTSVIRTVWLAGRQLAVVADRILGPSIRTLIYHWHAHAEAGWWIQDGWARVTLDATTLWFTSPQGRISEDHLNRLRGARGQLTLTAQADAEAAVVWWIFAASNAPPAFELNATGVTLRVLDHSFTRSDPLE